MESAITLNLMNTENVLEDLRRSGHTEEILAWKRLWAGAALREMIVPHPFSRTMQKRREASSDYLTFGEEAFFVQHSDGIQEEQP